tara:strand:- start:1347 stop:1784 length:438 start_codon:yes stop_codon:yes gene_type:complete
MSELTDKYSKNFSPAKKKAFEKRVFDNLGAMSELSAIMLVLAEMREEGMKSGGRVHLKSGSKTLSNYSKDIVDEYLDNVKEGYKGSIKKYILEFYGPEYLMSKGGLIDKPLGAGGKKSGPPPEKGPNSKGLNVKGNTVKTVKLEK